MLHVISSELAGHFKANLLCQLLPLSSERPSMKPCDTYLECCMLSSQCRSLGHPNVKAVGQKTEAPSI